MHSDICIAAFLRMHRCRVMMHVVRIELNNEHPETTAERKKQPIVDIEAQAQLIQAENRQKGSWSWNPS